MKNEGFTYIEVIISAALLSIIIMPVMAGFYNASLNQKYAALLYRASLCAENILVEVGSFIDSSAALPEGTTDLRVFLDDTPVVTEEFSIVLSITRGGGTRVFRCLPPNIEALPEAFCAPVLYIPPDTIIPSNDMPLPTGESMLRVTLNQPDGSELVLNGGITDNSLNPAVITLDIYDNEGKFLLRMGQIL